MSEVTLEEILKRLERIEKLLTPKLWYPDETGWVEVDRDKGCYPYPENINDGTILVEVLTRRERSSKYYDKCAYMVSDWNWQTNVQDPIVAYKVI